MRHTAQEALAHRLAERKRRARRELGDDSFWLQVDRSGGELACWPWRGRKHKKGYGIAERITYRTVMLPNGGIGRERTRMTMNASRRAWELWYGVKLPAGREPFVLHKCDNPVCCNVRHCFLGTHQDNMDDMKAKGRGRGPHMNGMAHPMAKFTPQQIATARRRRAAGEKARVIAEDLGMSVWYVYELARGERRKLG